MRDDSAVLILKPHPARFGRQGGISCRCSGCLQNSRGRRVNCRRKRLKGRARQHQVSSLLHSGLSATCLDEEMWPTDWAPGREMSNAPLIRVEECRCPLLSRGEYLPARAPHAPVHSPGTVAWVRGAEEQDTRVDALHLPDGLDFALTHGEAVSSPRTPYDVPIHCATNGCGFVTLLLLNRPSPPPVLLRLSYGSAVVVSRFCKM